MVDTPVDLVNRALALKSDIVVLPLRSSDDEGPVYSEASVMLVKELRSLGGDAQFAHSSGERVFEVKKSAEILLTLVLGVASNAAWYIIEKYLARREERRMSVTYVELEEGDRRGVSWTVEGSATEVVEAIDKLRRRVE